ncbi:unnamed protein product [Blepharisma stoltei]|uniref:Uncharacterized protein n=1 Tax=Blepharisma stoltei TaxID=1481888 RepID=A0AAU9JS74_9CILI|nr:unnamed protein product [Blepharisma stoltei]
MECYFSNCVRKPILVCECKSKKTLMCQFHRSNHFEDLPNCKHHINHLQEIQNPAPSKSEGLIKANPLKSSAFPSHKSHRNSSSDHNANFKILNSELEEVKSMIKATKKVLLAQTENAKTEISSYANYLLALLKGIKKKCKKLSMSSKCPFQQALKSKNNSYLSQKQSKITSGALKLKLQIEMINSKFVLNAILADLEKNSIIDLSVQKISQMTTPFDIHNLYGIYPDTKKLFSYNPNTNIVTSCELNLPNNLYGYSLCYADGNLFCYGNCLNKAYQGTAFLINKEGKIKSLRDGIPSIYSGTIYKKGFVYVFGGWSNGKMLANARKFNIKSNKWQILADLPVPGSLYCCEAIKNKILISGSSHSRLFIYDIYSNSYNKCSLKLCQGRKKIICKHYEKVYIIETEGSIYESFAGNIFEWEILFASNVQNRGMLMYKSYNYRSVFFSIDNKVFRFDLKTKSVKQELEV